MWLVGLMTDEVGRSWIASAVSALLSQLIFGCFAGLDMDESQLFKNWSRFSWHLIAEMDSRSLLKSG